MIRIRVLWTICIGLFTLFYSHAALAATVSFGSGANQFTMDFVPIGNPSNVADTTGTPNPVGAVAYEYQITTYEVSRDMIVKANADGGLGITLADMTSYGGNGLNRPATGVSWNEAARFVNWLNTSQGYQPAYKFAFQPGEVGYGVNANIELWISGDPGFNAANPFRNGLARYVLPSVDEWYKAAYYDAGSGNYFVYPTGSNTVPSGVASGTGAGSAVFDQSFATGPADISLAGGLSSYGTMGQGGNVYEWQETEYDLVNDAGPSARNIRGGFWGDGSTSLSSTYRGSFDPTDSSVTWGFRVAAVPTPEPSTYMLGTCGAVGLIAAVRRRRR